MIQIGNINNNAYNVTIALAQLSSNEEHSKADGENEVSLLPLPGSAQCNGINTIIISKESSIL